MDIITEPSKIRKRRIYTEEEYDLKNGVQTKQVFRYFFKGPFNNYEDKMSGGGGQKMSVFVHAGGGQKMAKFCPRSC